MNRKVAGELDRYGIAIAGVQETKWFSCDVWPATHGYTLLHSGQEEGKKRNEGVGIMLNKFARIAWTRIDMHGGSRESCNVFATIISVYTLTAKATENVITVFH